MSEEKKLTGAEIIQIFKDAGFSESDFGNGYFSVPYEFIVSDELNEIILDNESKHEAFISHPDYGKHSSGWSDEMKELHAIFVALPNAYLLKRNEYLDSIGVGEFTIVDCYGGEGQGETWYQVKYFPRHDVYIRTDAFYTSYEGEDFLYGYGEEVKPKEKTITVYE